MRVSDYTRHIPTILGNTIEITFCPKTCAIAANVFEKSKIIPISDEDLPHEFKKVTTVLQFDALIANSFLRAPKLSNGDYRLCIHQKGRGGSKLDEYNALISSIPRKYSAKFQAQINNFIRSFFSKVQNEEDLKNSQKKLQDFLESSPQRRSLLEFFNDLCIHSSMLDRPFKEEIRGQHTALKSLHNELAAPKPAYKKDWLAQFQLRPLLENLNHLLKKALTKPEITFQDHVLTMKGYFPKMSDLNKDIKNGGYSGIKSVQIFALHSVYLDEDLNLPSTNVSIIAPKWIVNENQKIILSGKNAKEHPTKKAKNGKNFGSNGSNGLPGEPGKPAGHFFGIGHTFENIDHLTIIANGGKGARGQDGGHGHNGKAGSDATKNNEFKAICFDLLAVLDEEKLAALKKRTGWDHIGNPFKSATSDIELTKYGIRGGAGGNGGKGGAGGAAGQAGKIEIISLKNESIAAQKEAVVGTKGVSGTTGRAGKGGVSGRDWSGLWHSKSWKWNGHPQHQPQHVGGGYAPNGKVFNQKIAGKKASKKGNVNIFEVLFNYRKFVILMNNEFNSQVTQLFRYLYDNHEGLTKRVTTERLITDCERMEDFYALSKDKIRCLPLYFWMQERVKNYIKNAKEVDKRLLQSLHTSLLTKILQVSSSAESRLIIDIKAFLKNVLENVKSLKEINKQHLINLYKNNYLELIKEKIQESEPFLELLRKDIKSSDGKLKQQVAALQLEIEQLKYQNKENLEQLENRRKRLKELISKRKILGCLSLSVQCMGFCLPPAGPLVAGFLSAGLNIVSNAETAPALVAQALDPYINAFSSLSSQRGIQLQQASLESISRIRTTTLFNSIKDICGASGSEKEQLATIDKAINTIDREQEALGTFRNELKNKLEPSLKELLKNSEKTQQILRNQSKIALQFDLLSVKRTFDTIIKELQVISKKFAAGDAILTIFQQVEQALVTSINIYQHVQEYQERADLVVYMAQLAAPDARDARIIAYERALQRNLILDQYTRAVAAVKQWSLGYEPKFLGNFSVLDEFISKASIEDLVEDVSKKLESLKQKVDEEQSEIQGQDAALWTGHFDNSPGNNGPFCVWKYADYPEQVSDLLQSKRVILQADIGRSPAGLSAIKCKAVKLIIKSTNSQIQNQIDRAMIGADVELQHSGISNYRVLNQIVTLVNDKGFLLGYNYVSRGSPQTKNNVFQKMEAGNYMLSPYTSWLVKFGKNIFNDFRSCLDTIELHLVGVGQYIKETN